MFHAFDSADRDALGIHQRLRSARPDLVRDPGAHTPLLLSPVGHLLVQERPGLRDTRWHRSAGFPAPKNSVTFMRERIIIAKAYQAPSVPREQLACALP